MARQEAGEVRDGAGRDWRGLSSRVARHPRAVGSSQGGDEGARTGGRRENEPGGETVCCLRECDRAGERTARLAARVDTGEREMKE